MASLSCLGRIARLPTRSASTLLPSISSTVSLRTSQWTPSAVLTSPYFQTTRGVKTGWSTAPKRSKHARFRQTNTGLPPLTTGPAAALARKEQSTPLRTGVLARKKGMSAVFVGKKRLPCTLLQLDSVQVLAQKTREKHGYYALQVGFGSRKPRNVVAPQLGYYEAKGIAPKERVAEFRVRSPEGLLPVGVQLHPDWFKPGQYVDARSNTRGMGFTGAMKRWGFSGQPASHGVSKTHRALGSVGQSQGGGSRVYPGKKMAGRMGNERVTLQNLEVLQVDNETGLVAVKGAVGGPKGAIVMIQDAIKKHPPPPSFCKKALDNVLERNPDVQEKLVDARRLHLELKRQRLLETGRPIDNLPQPEAPIPAATLEAATA